MSLYDINIEDQEGKKITLNQYKNKVLLIVNTATGCGFTPQYKGLQKLYDTHAEKGFEILDFPCNQFNNQTPGDNQATNNFCEINFGTTFPRFSKVDVNGKNESPIYTYLKKAKSGLLGEKIKWNFTKFLVSKDGTIIKRYAPADKPEKIEKDIIELLK